MNRVIQYKDIPATIPLFKVAVVWLLLDRLQPPGWVYGVVWTMVVALLMGSIVAVCLQTQLPVAFRDGEPRQ